MMHLMIFFFILQATRLVAIQGDEYVVYSRAQMEEHKRKCKDRIVSSPTTYADHSYQLQRALLTISADDADYIPKIKGAGEIFRDAPIPYQLMHNGVKIVLNSYYDVQWLTDVIYALMGHHEPQEEKCFHEILKYIPEDATMIELGSYWAYYSLWFASEIKNAKNYLIEPDAFRLEVGKKNFLLNNKTGFFKRAFVGKLFDVGPEMTGAGWISIDEFIEQERIKHIHILHSDIQSAEYEMLLTSVRHLDIIDYFFISTHSNEIHNQCLNFLKDHGFMILAEHNLSQSCSADGLIVAKRIGVAGPEKIDIRKYG